MDEVIHIQRLKGGFDLWILAPQCRVLDSFVVQSKASCHCQLHRSLRTAVDVTYSSMGSRTKNAMDLYLGDHRR